MQTFSLNIKKGYLHANQVKLRELQHFLYVDFSFLRDQKRTNQQS